MLPIYVMSQSLQRSNMTDTYLSFEDPRGRKATCEARVLYSDRDYDLAFHSLTRTSSFVYTLYRPAKATLPLFISLKSWRRLACHIRSHLHLGAYSPLLARCLCR